MELIKEIKKAENRAQEIIEKARVDAVESAKESKKNRLAVLEQAGEQRKQAIETAQSDAEAQGLAEIKKLKLQAQKERRKLHDKVAGKLAGAATKVMDCLKG